MGEPAPAVSRGTRRRWLLLAALVAAAFVVVAFVLAVTALLSMRPVSPQSATDGTPSATMTTWDHLVERLRYDGEVTAELAVTAYSLLIEPLPGVPAAAPAPDAPLSATPAIRWVLARWDELSPDQRAAIEHRLFESLPPPAGAGVPLAVYGGLEPAAPPGQRDLEDVISRLGDGDYLGVPFRHSALLVVAEEVGRSAPAFAYPARWNGFEWEDVERGTDDWTCVVGVRDDYRVGPRTDLLFLLAHEAFHCYQFELIGPGHEDALWVWEGSANWVGAAFTGGTPFLDPAWHDYLILDDSLFARDYDALGFFAHLDEHVSLWPNILDLIDVPSRTFEEAASLGGTRFLESWPTGLSRQRAYGAGWNTNGPGITTDQRPFESDSPGEGTTELTRTVAPGNQLLFLVATDRKRLMRVSVEGYGGVYLGDGRTEWTGGSHSGLYCLGVASGEDRCQCPDGGAVPGMVATVISLPIGLTGTHDAAELSVRIIDPESVCDDTVPDDSFGSCDELADDYRGLPGILAAGKFSVLATAPGEDDTQPYETPRNCIVLVLDEDAGTAVGEVVLPTLYGDFGSPCDTTRPVNLSGPLAGTFDPETGELAVASTPIVIVDCDALGREVHLVSLTGQYDPTTGTVFGTAVGVLWETPAKERAVSIGPFRADVVGR